jgi:3-oxoacyl-[acyl-carrier protein] reductase
MPVKTDVSKVQEITDMVEAVGQKYGRIDVLVNNAGIIDKAPFDQLTEQEWDRVMNVNLKSAFFASQQVLKYMTKQKSGKIINIASLAGRTGGFSVGCAYSASKAAMIGLTKSLARKVAGYNINVNTVAPGPTESDIGLTEEDYEALKKNILLGRVGKQENIADVVAFLAGDGAAFMTGATIDVNGGMFIG